MRNTNYSWAILFVIVVVAMCAITSVLVRTRSLYPTLSDALELAKSNRSELRKVLEHYGAEPADSLKLKAAEFLITNMISKGEDSKLLINKTGEKLPNLPDYTDIAEYNAEINHLIATQQASIEGSIKNDLETITSDYLIRQIELAFKAWGKPWSKNIPFEDFCNYILPYRAANEPLSEMREALYDRYMPILDTVPGLIDPLEACRRMNEVLRDSMRYERKTMFIGYSRSLEDIYVSGYGQCNDMTLVGLHVMRAVGIPVVKETTLWPRMHLGHEWCSVRGADGKWHAFGPGEDQPDSLSKKWGTIGHLTAAKIYRETYAWQKNEKLETLFRSGNYPTAIYNSFFVKDATADYLPLLSITLPVMDESTASYLCIYNTDGWKPIDFAINKDGVAQFDNIGRDFKEKGFPILYTHCTYNDGKLTMCNPPFEILSDGSIHEYCISKEKIDISLPMEDPDVDYAYSCWNPENGRWESVTPKSRSETYAVYTDIPEDAMLLRHGGIDVVGPKMYVIKNGEWVVIM